MTSYTHSFVVPAYGDSPYLPECVSSLMSQTRSSEVLIATSTPSPYLSDVAKQFGVPLFVGNHQSGISRDWNFALAQATTDFVTVTNHDEVYDTEYAEKVMAAAERAHHPIMVFTDYVELRDNEIVSTNLVMRIKRLMNAPLRPRWAQRSKFIRNRVLSVGDPIMWPTVAFNRSRFPDYRFDEDYINDLDWDICQRMAQESGSFIYLPQVLMKHRIHSGTVTSEGIKQGRRRAEDYQMLRRYWPVPIAKLVAAFYAHAETSN